jgi:hypothetical protein
LASSLLGSEVRNLWATYLNENLGSPRPAQTFSAPGGAIEKGFTDHPATLVAGQKIVESAVQKLHTKRLDIPVGASTEVALSSIVPDSDVQQLLQSGGDAEMCFNDALSIPGNIAGGIGVGQDERNAGGTLKISKYEVYPMKQIGRITDKETQRDDSKQMRLTVVPNLTFVVKDVIDFCPGNLGGWLAESVTYPMSRLEASEKIHGQYFAADLPIRVQFHGPGTSIASMTLDSRP